MKELTRLPALLAAATLVLALPVSILSADPIDDPAVEAHIVKGDELAAAGHFGSARSEYKKAVELQRQQGVLPEVALRRIANTYYFQDRFQAAGATLVDLAEEAATYGDISVEVWALADAAWIAGIEGNKQVMERHLAEVDKLLTSPYLPTDVKAQVRSKRLAAIEANQHYAIRP